MAYGVGLLDDVDLVEQVEDALLEDEQVQAHLIRVERKGGVIYLRGRATTPQAREAATRAAARVPGVQAVVNELELRRRS
ncbi:MAG: BON domain-containing protein [Armatimonadota bacterium]|nr:BON domain-containing protein [Armatimonadota bacterium]